MKKIGKYEIRDVIGQGGMGKIYKAVEPKSGKTVIIKQLMVTNKATIEKRFQREADLMSSFSHRNIVKVFDIFKVAKFLYISMEYVHGMTLDDLIKKHKKMSVTAATLVLLEICRGLRYAHQKNIIHRDMKPDNILLARKGEVKLCDFGIATAQPGSDEGLTNTGVIMGTPAFMSPEQLFSTKHVDRRSDIYSLGVLFYQMLTGEQAFPSTFSSETIAKIRKGKYVAAHKLNPEIPGYFRKILKKTMHVKKEKRFDSLDPIINILLKHSKDFQEDSDLKDALKDYFGGNEIIVKKRSSKEKNSIKKRSKVNKQKNKPVKFIIKQEKPKKNKKKAAVKKAVKPVEKKSKKIAVKKQTRKNTTNKKHQLSIHSKETVQKTGKLNKNPSQLICKRKTYDLNKSNTISIGRKTSNEIVLANDAQVSRIHTKVMKKGKNGFIIDMSTNGTILNGRKIPKRKKTRIYPDDVILVGKTKITVR